MLLKLLGSTDTTRISSSVLALSSRGPLAEPITNLGVDLTALEMPKGLGALRHVPRITKWIRSQQPDVIQTWMYHADFLGGIAARCAGNRRIAWGVRHGEPGSGGLKGSTKLVAKLCALLSKSIPRRIVCPSIHAKQAHIALGYSSDKWEIIPNGFDTARFHPDPLAHSELRAELGIKHDDFVVGFVGRHHPSKDIGTLLAAILNISRRLPTSHFVLTGQGFAASDQTMSSTIRDLGVAGRVRLLGPRSDVQRIYQAIDILMLSSRTEAFPNVVGEAMSSAIPCAVTNVGDCPEIVGETGRISEPSDPDGLAESVIELLSMPIEERLSLGAKARQRILEHYSMEQTTNRFMEMYEELSTECAA